MDFSGKNSSNKEVTYKAGRQAGRQAKTVPVC
jgi:hypothetical protein